VGSQGEEGHGVRLFKNPKQAVYWIVGFVVLLLILFSVESRGSELRFEAGQAIFKGHTPTVGMNLKWREAGPVRTDYEAGFHLIGSSDHPGKEGSPNSFTLYGQLVDGYRWFELGLGFAFTNVDNLYHCRFTANMMAGLTWERLTLRWYHNSSAGSCRPNTGRDLLKLGWRF
jgi:hypothetical protein